MVCVRIREMMIAPDESYQSPPLHPMSGEAGVWCVRTHDPREWGMMVPGVMVASDTLDLRGECANAAENTRRTVSGVSRSRITGDGTPPGTRVDGTHPTKARVPCTDRPSGHREHEHARHSGSFGGLGPRRGGVLCGGGLATPRQGPPPDALIPTGNSGDCEVAPVSPPREELRTGGRANLHQGGTKMDNTASNSYFLQRDLTADYPWSLARGEWIILYKKAEEESARFEFSSALASPDKVPELLESIDRDLNPDQGGPEFSGDGSDTEVVYLKHGPREGMRPIILLREFSGSHPEYFEVAEEFRLYHNLVEILHPEDRDRRTLFKIEDSGERVEVAHLTRNVVRVKASFLRRFLEFTGLCLVLYVDSTRYSRIPIHKIPKSDREKTHADGTARWEMRIGEHQEPYPYKTFSHFVGKGIMRANAGDSSPPTGETGAPTKDVP